jgi:peptide/nickel transport system ATP-binding protein
MRASEVARYTARTALRGPPFAPPTGCHFHPRCPAAMDRCRTERPALAEIAPGRFSACHLNAMS